MEHLVETLGAGLLRIIRYLLIDILIELLIQGLGYFGLQLLKWITGGRYPVGPISEQSEKLKITAGMVMILLVVIAWFWAVDPATAI